ncbi:D-2-hydroxyacid dehydrogenase family protein [Arthrobacter sp. NPDC089319]|uniref:D-2-hydroxyacid dehydrogenase family protein n=1 Tax=Arthrobacter sp. NPDC089319 TaxID=3155915 RepID=UPI0034183693
MKIAILDDYQDVALSSAPWEQLPAGIAVERFTDHLDDVDALAERLAGAQVVVTMRERTPITAELMDRLPGLKLVTTTGMRNASIDLDAARQRGVTVCGTQKGTAAPAELAWALVMAVAREIPQNDRDVRAGIWQARMGIDLAGSTIGLLGLGRLGQLMAGYAAAFGMEVLAWSPHLTTGRAAEHGAQLVSKEDLFRRSDIVSIHLKLAESTVGMVGAAELDLLGPAGRLVNTSRGPLVDEAALVAALADGRIAAAALDVFDVEPLPRDSPLLDVPNLIISPHIGFVTVEAHRLGYTQMLEGILAYLDGAPINVLT